MISNSDKRLYIIDADPGSARDLSLRVTGLGFTVAGAAYTIEEALTGINAASADMILLDIDSQEEDRLCGDVIGKIRGFTIPVVYISSAGEQPHVEKYLAAEPYGFIPKPVSDPSIWAALEIAFKRLRLEKHLIVSERKYRGIFEESKDAIFISDSNGFIVDYNCAMARLFGYGDHERMDLLFNDLYCNLDEVVKYFRWLEQHGFIKDMEVALKRRNGSQIDGLLSSSYLNEGDHGVRFYQNIIKEITPIKQRAFEEIQASLGRLNEVLHGIIEAISLTVEAKDPYTAGHQREVSYLSVQIAKEMGFDKDRIEGLRIAALIHDLGKISVPAEILVKPDRLSEIEFAIVKDHPLVGYNILKPINFPWPVAEVIRQHHERMDGSGYPQSLSGERILMEARIVGVADVVEAIASHRPYRPSLGMQAAVDEIRNGRGRRYDAEVVDAFLSIWNRAKWKNSAASITTAVELH